ncbi:MAG: SIR2 family protein [Nitrospirae bacterium]|nr:SIR2 family protein [Nitrospirota bacterium]
MQDIVRAIANRTCVIFAGAGLSRNAGLPSWLELITHLVQTLSQNGKIAEAYLATINLLLNDKRLPECMDLLLMATNRKDILLLLREALKPKSNSTVHDALKKLQLRGYITTNYDRLLEDICGSTSYHLTNSLEKLSLIPTALGSHDVQFVLKLHGDIDDMSPPDHSEVTKGGPFIILSKTDYTVMLQGDRGIALKLALFSVLQNASILFLGYTYGDPDITLAFDFLSKNCQFPRQSWFVGLSGQPMPALPSNITAIQPFAEWSQLSDWLISLSTQVEVGRSSTTPSSVPHYAVPAKDRQALLALGEFINGLETEDLFAKTILSILVPELRSRATITEAWVSQFIASLLDLGPVWADTFAQAVLKELLEFKLVTPEDDPQVFRVNAIHINQLYRKASTEWDEERTAFTCSITQRLMKSGLILNADLFLKFEQVLQSLCMEYGHSMAEWIHRGIGEEIRLLDIQGVVAQHFEGEETRRQMEELLRLIFEKPAEGEISYIYRLLSSAFLLNSVKLDPTASKFIHEGIAQYHLYLDANVLLPLIVREHSNHDWVASLIAMTKKSGASLYAIEDILEEVRGHRKVAQDIYDVYRNDLEDLSLYRSISGQRSNCFVDGYINCPQRKTQKWGDYLRSYSDSKIYELLAKHGVVAEKVPAENLDLIAYADVLQAIEEEWGKRLHGAMRNRALNKHEAKQFLHIYGQRKRQLEKGYSDDVWFLSSETVFERVFLKAPQKWGRPPTFPLSAWASFIDSRMVFQHSKRKHVLSAILQGNSIAYSLPGSIALVRKKLFGSTRVLSKAEHDALKVTFSGGQLIKRLDKARNEVLKRSHRDPESLKEYFSIQESVEQEVRDDLNEKLEALSKNENMYKQKVEQLTKQLVEAAKVKRPKKAKKTRK